MARINIEDELHKDKRFIKLIVKMGGDEDKAIGALTRAWSVAQKFWKYSDHGIPKSEWEKQELSREIIDVGLAEDRGDFIYVKGSKERFAWLREKISAGSKGGKASSLKKKGKSPKQNQASAQLQLPSTTTSGSRSHYGSISGSEKILYHDGDREIQSPVGYFIATYVNCYQSRYGAQARPPLGGKVQGLVKRFLKDTPLQRACQLIQQYLEMSDAWFINKGHDFETFYSNQAKIALALDADVRVNLGKGREAERAQNSSDNWDEAARMLRERGKHDN